MVAYRPALSFADYCRSPMSHSVESISYFEIMNLVCRPATKQGKYRANLPCGARHRKSASGSDNPDRRFRRIESQRLTGSDTSTFPPTTLWKRARGLPNWVGPWLTE